MNLNYNFNERKTTLTGFPKTKKLKWENFQRTYEEENKLPEYVKGNADWVKDLYRDIDSLPAVNTAALERKNKIKSDFINEAEKIYKFDKNTREKDYIKEFETDYFDSKIKEAGFNIQNSEWNNKTPYNKSEIESSSKLVNTFENKSDDNTYGDVKIEKMGNIVKTIGEFLDGKNEYSASDSYKAYTLSNKAEDNAIQYAKKNGSVGRKVITWDNTVDAMRHTEWNSMMTREMGYEKACFFANNHEIAELKKLGWFKRNENGRIITKMNQPTLMDIWNNSTGRALAMDKSLHDLNYDKLFEHAKLYNMLITDASTAYEYYGVIDYINKDDWTVNVEWDTNKGEITFKQDKLPDITLRVGLWGV
ncbi:MAG: hypothetical protein E7389_01570 [Ruminococcaceae bacterium]|nr:hypothetical protein [Oscillospiraceae bacterium]